MYTYTLKTYMDRQSFKLPPGAPHMNARLMASNKSKRVRKYY